MNLYGKLIGLGLLLAALAGVYATGHHQGAAVVQAQWAAAKGRQAAVAAQASEAARATEQHWSSDFAAILSTYQQATDHAYPSLADALPAAVAAGTVRLRNACPAPAGSGMSDIAARSRAADAAATQALADRTAAAIAAVRAGGAADAREFQLRAQVTGLQAVLTAERAHR